ncbi:hypothetical protein F0562_005778 [Nyssa sinensis]|uniref:Transcriptional corepressor SEUSS n=1 Tax=Nyssa sinensis TaxID=561372 RepID=A0A5J5ALK2_9ASTE|nr:hypothetical protein F0562_005778 [Nyssa sinensis]
MVLTGPPTPIGGAQSVSPTLLRSNSAILRSQGGSMAPQASFSSLSSPQTQYNMNMLGNNPNISSLLSQSFGNGGLNPAGSGSFQRGGIDTVPVSDPLSVVANDIGYTPSLSFVSSNMVNTGSAGLVQNQQISNSSGNQMSMDQQQLQAQQYEPQRFQHGQLSVPAILCQWPTAATFAAISVISSNMFPHQNLTAKSAGRPAYEPGMCARRLTHYMCQQQCRPNDNNIEFWRNFVAEFFAPSAKKRWCVSLYGNSRQTSGVFPQHLQETWHCEICNLKPGRGFETTVEVLPRLYKIKYDSGTLEELLYVDMPHEYHNACGQIVLHYAKAIQESVFEQLRVVRDGQLRIVFSPDLKICSWEFCARHHEELIPRRLIIPPVGQLGAAAQKYQAAAQNASSNLPTEELQRNCNTFFSSARQLAKALEVPLVNDLGYTKRYVRCLQISEVVNSMKDLIDYSRETRMGPVESLAKFPRRTSLLSGLHNSGQQPEGQQQQPISGQNLNNDHNSVPATSVQFSTCSGVASASDSHGTTSTITSATTVAELLHQNSMNTRQENLENNPSSPYAGTPVQIPSAGSSTTLSTAQPNPSSPFSAPTPSSSNNPPQTSHIALAGAVTPATPIHISSRNSPAHVAWLVLVPEGINMKNITGIPQKDSNSLSGGGGGSSRSYLAANGIVNNNSSIGFSGFGNLNGGIGLSATASGIGAAMGNNSDALSGRVGISVMPQDASLSHQQQEFGNQLFNGLGAANGFNSLQFDWNSSS